MSDDSKNELTVFSDLNMERVFKDPVESFSDEQAATAWATVDLLEKVVKERKEALRQALLKRAQSTGEKNENGSHEAKMGTTTVISERRQEKLPDGEVVKAALKKAGLEYEDGFSAQMVWTMDPSKVDFLLQGGKFPAEEAEKIEASKKVTYALKVKPDKVVKGQLDSIKKRLTSGE